MPRSGPSAADTALLSCLAGRGVDVSASQLERWRRWGLIPAPARTWTGASGSSSAYVQPLEQVADHVAAVAARMHRGADRELVAVALTADGLVVDENLVRAGYGKVLAHFAGEFAGPLAAVPPARPDDEYSDTFDAAGLVLEHGGAEERRWARRLKARPDVLEDSTPEQVRVSAVAGLLAMVDGREVSDEVRREIAVASGLEQVNEAVLAMAETIDAEAGGQEPLLLGSPFTGGRVFDVLTGALEGASIEQIRAAAAVVVLNWRATCAQQSLKVVTETLGGVDGDHVMVHGLGVAMLLACLADSPGDIDAMALFTSTFGNLTGTETARLEDAVRVLRVSS